MVATRRIQAMFQPIEEQRPIGQAGQRIIERQLLDPRGLELLFTDIGHHPDALADCAARIAHDNHRKQHGAAIAIAVPTPELPLPAILARNRFFDALIELRLLTPGFQHPRGLVDNRVGAIAGQGFKRGVDHHDAIVLIADHDRLQRLLKHHFGKALIGLLSRAFDSQCCQCRRLPQQCHLPGLRRNSVHREQHQRTQYLLVGGDDRLTDMRCPCSRRQTPARVGLDHAGLRFAAAHLLLRRPVLPLYQHAGGFALLFGEVCDALQHVGNRRLGHDQGQDVGIMPLPLFCTLACTDVLHHAQCIVVAGDRHHGAAVQYRHDVAIVPVQRGFEITHAAIGMQRRQIRLALRCVRPDAQLDRGLAEQLLMGQGKYIARSLVGFHQAATGDRKQPDCIRAFLEYRTKLFLAVAHRRCGAFALDGGGHLGADKLQ